MIMPIAKENSFDDHSDVLLVGIYTDKISVVVVGIKKDAVQIIAVATEPQESGELSLEKIQLNTEKALQKLPAETLVGAKRIFCFSGGGVSELRLIVKNKIRSEKDKKISEQELVAIASENQNDFTNIEETFLVDGFLVENPIGMDGKEITARILRVSSNKNLEKIMAEIATSRDMRYLGALDARLALIKTTVSAEKDYCAIFVFEKNITICVVRNGSITNTSNIDGGYGIITEEMARRTGVGSEEAKNILNDFKNNKLESAAVELISAILAQGATAIKDKIRNALAEADKTSLLPGTVRIAISERNTDLEKILAGSDWLVGLPIERNIAVIVEIPENEEVLCPFDCAAINYLTDLIKINKRYA